MVDRFQPHLQIPIRKQLARTLRGVQMVRHTVQQWQCRDVLVTPRLRLHVIHGGVSFQCPSLAILRSKMHAR